MNCQETRDQLEQGFDDDARLSAESEAHLAQCNVCRSYRDELAAVKDSLGNLPVEAPAPGLSTRVKAHVTVHGSAQDVRMPVAAGLALVVGAVVAASAAGWFFPVSVDFGAWWSAAVADRLEWFSAFPVGFDAWWDVAAAYLPEMDWRQAASSLSSPVNVLSESVTPGIEEFTGWFPPGALWLCLGLGAMLLIGYNGFEALRLRTTPVNGSEQAS